VNASNLATPSAASPFAAEANPFEPASTEAANPFAAEAPQANPFEAEAEPPPEAANPFANSGPFAIGPTGTSASTTTRGIGSMSSKPAAPAPQTPYTAPAPDFSTKDPEPTPEEEEEPIELKALQIMNKLGNTEGGSQEVEINQENVTFITECIMKERESSDMEIAIVSVMGKFRSGKSFLLNILSHYFLWLEKNQERLRMQPRGYGEEHGQGNDYRYSARQTSTSWLPEWLPEEIQTPFDVDAESDSKTCTMGLWILNKPYFLRNPNNGKKVALLLMDSQGADDGELDEAQSRAILGITTVCSSVVIYNIKSPLDTKHVKDLGDLANIFQVAISEIKNLSSADTEMDYCFGKLWFFIRDVKFKDGINIPQCIGSLKEKYDKMLDPEKVMLHKDLVAQLYETFKPLERWGLPNPGMHADFAQQATTRNMKQLSDDFKKLLDEFVKRSFEHDFPVPVKKVASERTLTAREFYSYLDTIKTAFAACLVKGGDPQIVAMHKEEVAQDAFKTKIAAMDPASQTDFPQEKLDIAKKESLDEFRMSLEKSGMSPDDKERWCKKCEQWMDYYVSTYQVEFQIRQRHGDRALMGVAAAVALGSGFHLWGLLYGAGHLPAGIAVTSAVPVAGYVRHANEHHLPYTSGEAMQSFAQTSYDRTLDMARSTLRFGKKTQDCLASSANKAGPAVEGVRASMQGASST